ncbi:hypothetical protein A6E12_01700 [Aliivibrio fischeri]|uniref:Eco57I restriction-modification methylase domain-containing protein n=1 Tax=Aliivibrio fischeri TaxID=668 RepID=UPI00080D8D9D|nr:N-6 DNA methylase [Aliivibrio fischeri]OCH25683.1 hypothetical protein A6E12_01700 [Aliivibrio fischeri]
MNQALYEKLSDLPTTSDLEEGVRAAWITAFSDFGVKLKVEVDRNDLSYNNVIIELKSKGSFNGKISSAKFNEAIDQRLDKYIREKSKKEGLPTSEYTGIVSDGHHVAFCYMVDGKMTHKSLMPISPESAEKLLLALKDAQRRAVTALNLIEDFGHNSPIGINLMNSFAEELSLHFNSNENNKIKMLFSEWQSLFGQVANLTKDQIKKIENQVGFQSPKMNDQSLSGSLFIIHTYNALLMKLLGAELISNLGLTQYPDFCEHAFKLKGAQLLSTLKVDIEDSALFDRVGIKGFVEEAIFSWYLESTSKTQEIEQALKALLIKLSLYRFDDLTSARSKDVLKAFYQALVPDVLRKSLGEFYTPDWLVEETIKQSNPENNSWLEQKVLDPTCGSGSFLLQIIKLKRDEAEVAGLTAEQTLDLIIATVWGFDLNPLAVQAARVNFLIAISDLVKECRGNDIELPILLADSVYSPSKDPNNFDSDIVEYKIGSPTANLHVTIPTELAFNREKLDEVFEIMGQAIEDNWEFDQTASKLIEWDTFTPEQLVEWDEHLRNTYDQVLDLHKQNWNGIWFRIIRNFFWSATAGTFDLIIGNPPWVRWSALPIDYREKVKKTCELYQIFSDNKYHGGNELDISGMITYTTADKWLNYGGKLVFVITQTHLQSPSSQGFRNFKINDCAYLKPLFVEDLKELKPFPDAANKTVIIGFEKIRELSNPYPVSYHTWEAKKGYKKTISDSLHLNDVLQGIERTKKEANPVDDYTSPWAIMNIGDFEKTSYIRGKSKWINGHKGVTADLNGIYMVNISEIRKNLVSITTRPEAGKKDIGPAKSFDIEPNLLYPLVKGASDFSAFKFHPKHNLYHIVPNKGITKQTLLDAEKVMNSKGLKKTFEYLRSYKNELCDRSTYKQRLKKYDFYHIYNVGSYTFSPFKVIWPEQSKNFKAAVCSTKNVPLVGERPYVPDHKVYFVDFDNKDEAHFMCGLLNCSIVKSYIESHTISIQVGNIFKHLELPQYDPQDKDSVRLAELSEILHETEDTKVFKNLLDEAEDLAVKVISKKVSS